MSEPEKKINAAEPLAALKFVMLFVAASAAFAFTLFVAWPATALAWPLYPSVRPPVSVPTPEPCDTKTD